jgi:phosphotriesterase-related protein
MTDPTAGRRQYTRREALGLLGTAAASGAGAAAFGAAVPLHAQQTFTSAEPPTFAEGAIIRTLQGDVDPAELAEGATLFHEHVGRGDVDLAVEELAACAFDGLGCIVDAATGRRTPEQVEHLNAIAARSEVRIVMAGGYFEDIGFRIYPVRIAEASEDELVEELVQDAAAQRWGAFGEIGSSLEMRPDERKVHRAIGRAHVATGLPIFTHTPHESCPSCAMDQMDALESVGVDFSHLVIGHMSTIRDEHDPLGTHSAIARRGAFVGLDTVGHEMSRSQIPEIRKVRMVQDLLDAGLEDHILLSSDMGNVRQFKRYYGHGWASVLMQFVPKLRYAGVPEETIRKILVDNPRRFLAFVPPA